MAIQSICSVPNCDKPARSRGWCAMHYSRWQKHGDPEGGRTPNGDQQRYFNEVVMAYEGTECLIWPYKCGITGYPVMGPNIVSRLVCIEVNGPPPTPEHEAAHSCGNGIKACVTKRHLSWKTPLENKADELLHGTRNRGERQGHAKLTSENVREIRALKGHVKSRDVAKRFGVSEAAISAIHHRTHWAWLD